MEDYFPKCWPQLLYVLFQGKSYYSAGIYPFLIAVCAVFFEKILKRNISRMVLTGLILVLSCNFFPMGKPIYKPEKLVRYFDKMEQKTHTNNVHCDEDDSILWTTDNKDTVFNMLSMYLINSKRLNWWQHANVIIWGASAKLVGTYTQVQTEIKEMIN